MPAIIIAWFLFVIALACGQILNIVDLLTGFATMPQNELIVRIVGLVVVPVGAWMGWF